MRVSLKFVPVRPRAHAQGSYTLTAPFDGVVTQRKATVSKLVGLEEMLFEVVDTSAMWADLDVPEADLAAVAAGQPVTVTIDVLGARAERRHQLHRSGHRRAHAHRARPRAAREHGRRAAGRHVRPGPHQDLPAQDGDPQGEHRRRLLRGGLI